VDDSRKNLRVPNPNRSDKDCGNASYYREDYKDR